jgi:hypothetical protein
MGGFRHGDRSELWHAAAVVFPRLRLHVDRLFRSINELDYRDAQLPWIENSEETQQFVRYWFGPKQRRVLSRIAYSLKKLSERSSDSRCVDALKVALSRVIVTKEVGASLARDVSHSRPHKVQETSDFDVLAGFRKSVAFVTRWLAEGPTKWDAIVRLGDARDMYQLQPSSVDLVLTSPPYLNAIDYLRGHKLALIWLGFTIEQLRSIRGSCIGSERTYSSTVPSGITAVINAICTRGALPPRSIGMITRYSVDIWQLMEELVRVLKTDGKAVLVVGDCCIRSVFVSNSNGIVKAAQLNGLRLLTRSSRELPNSKRYLPITSGGPISRRMRTETVLTFRHA